MLLKKHFNLISYLLLAEKHQQLLLKNVEFRLAWEIHTTVAQLAVAMEAHAAEASKRPPRGSYRKSQPPHPAREMRAYAKSDVHKGYG